MDLGHRDILAGKAAPVERLGGSHHQYATDLQLPSQITDHHLDTLAPGQALAKGDLSNA